MAIQLRRGDYADFDPSQLLDGELAVVLENDPDTDDGTALYVGFGDGNVKRVAFADEVADVDVATTEAAGIVKPDGTTIEVDADGTISVPDASTSADGLMSAADKSKLNGVASGATANVASSTAPAMDGTASAGSSTDYARADHVHPTDTSRASATDLSTHTSDTTAHVTAAERSTWSAKADATPATTDAIGLVKPDNETIAVDEDGTLSGIVVKHSDGTDAGPIVELTARGHAEQSTTVGKNLLDSNEFTSTTTTNGVTFTNNGGSFSVSGKATATTNIGICWPAISPKLAALVSNGGTFTFSSDKAVYNNSTFNLSISYSESGTTKYLTLGSTATITAGATFVNMNLYAANGTNVTTYTDFHLQIEAGSTATAYEPYTGGAPSPSPDYPQEIQVVRGHEVTGKTGRFVDLVAQSRNLFNPANFVGRTINGITFTPNADGTVTANGTATATATMFLMDYEGIRNTLSVGETYNIHGDTPSGVYIQYYTGTASIRNTSFVVGEIVSAQNMVIYVQSGKTLNNVVIKPMLERGSVATPYEPYYYSTTPIPLPSRGWAAGLPDGTADVLTLDGAGKVVWERKTEEVVLDGSTNAFTGVLAPTQGNTGYRFGYTISDAYRSSSDYLRLLASHGQRSGGAMGSNVWRVGDCALYNTTFYIVLNNTTVADANTWLSTHPVTVLYPLATPVTESRGYVDLPEIPEGATISIPELDALGVHYLTDDAAAAMARQWYERARAEYAVRIEDLETTVAYLMSRTS